MEVYHAVYLQGRPCDRYNEAGPNSGIAATDGWFINNTLVVGGGSFSYFGAGYASNCFLVGKPQLASAVYGNAVHSSKVLRVPCLNASAPAKGCALSCPLGEWLTQGYDRGTTIGPLPRDEEIIAAARLLLGMPSAGRRSHGTTRGVD